LLSLPDPVDRLVGTGGPPTGAVASVTTASTNLGADQLPSANAHVTGSRLYEPGRRLPVDRGSEDDLGRLVDETLITPVVIFAGLVRGILWNLVTW
jgi:hypothetical protein